MIVKYLRKSPTIHHGLCLDKDGKLDTSFERTEFVTIATPGRLYAVLLLDDSHEDGLRLGWSLCCKRDNFSRKTGRALAEARLADWDSPKPFHKVAAALKNPIRGLLERWVEAKVAEGWTANVAESYANALLFSRIHFTRGGK